MQLRPCKSEWPALLPKAVVTPRPELQMSAISESVALLQPGSVLMSSARVTIEGHAHAQGLGPCWCPRARRVLGLCQSECPALQPGQW